MLQGIIDIGSNTVRLAVYELKGNNVDFIMKKKHMVGLAAYLDNNKMTHEGIERLCEVLHEYRSFLESFRIKNVVAFTTAALRNCTNSKEAVAEIIRRTGIAIEVISGEKEAELDFIGATRNSHCHEGILADIGGASTELVLYSEGRILKKISLHMGSLAFKTRFCSGLFPNAFELGLMKQEAERILATAEDFMSVKSNGMCGIGGTFKGTCALYNALFPGEKYNLAFNGDKIQELINYLTREEELPEEDVILLLKHIPDRIPTIIPGMVIASVLVEKFGIKEIEYSDSGVREGFIYSELLGEGEI